MTMAHKHQNTIVHKRSRDDGQSGTSRSQLSHPPHFPLPTSIEEVARSPPDVFKRSRSNNYGAPKVIRPSILTATGSLVGGGGRQDSNVTVKLRRQLSSGDIEAFVGGHEKMDMDSSDAKPRRMSF
jgi:hypothetical protein